MRGCPVRFYLRNGESRITDAIFYSACPYTLTGPGCGHTYCATCILQWAFDGITPPPIPQQNSQLECPLCRAELPLFLTQNAPFPFVPARLVDEMLSDLLGQLAQMSNESKSGGAVSEWGQGGAAKLDWLKRDKYVILCLSCLPFEVDHLFTELVASAWQFCRQDGANSNIQTSTI